MIFPVLLMLQMSNQLLIVAEIFRLQNFHNFPIENLTLPCFLMDSFIEVIYFPEKISIGTTFGALSPRVFVAR